VLFSSIFFDFGTILFVIQPFLLFWERFLDLRDFFSGKLALSAFWQEGFLFPGLALCNLYFFLQKMIITTTTAATLLVFAVSIAIPLGLMLLVGAVLTTYPCCAWAGGTESQFVVGGKFIPDSYNTCLKFNIRLKILWVIYILMYIMFSFVKKALLNKLFYRLMPFLFVEVLRFWVHQCVVSFCSHFQHGLLPLLTPLLSDPNIIAILFANAASIVAATAELPLLLWALFAIAIAIMWGFISKY
jgi:hypothetical protein